MKPQTLQMPPAATGLQAVAGASIGSSVDRSSAIFMPKTLNRRNLKKLTLDAPSSSAAPAGIDLRDPDRKASADELISHLQNLELGLEYQITMRVEDLVTLKKLGAGNSGTVSKVLHIPSKKIMARKVIHIETKELIHSQIIRELRIMHECDSPFIIDFFGAFIDQGDVVICMEYVDCSSLDKNLRMTGPFPEVILKQVAWCVLSGLNYLYDHHRIIHRDVKPSNVLLDSKGGMKLCDFGVSRELINSIADTFVGTSTYMSPERIQGGVYSVKGDVWSLGLMLVELATGKFPFGDNSNRAPDSILDLLQRIVNEHPPSLKPEDGFSADLCDFVDMCLKREKERGDPHKLMLHPFLQGCETPEFKSEVKRWAKNVRRAQKGKAIK
ncbi:unnamed protein product [Kuraishia capsulata CBS 1993]|uniref:mitogen-activated protein kinase kinase n=1 Tax=Kuraishia capsulata CBS 1993 TaxID=1382522 RepID=W6MRG3_9ASCO|nr:uncharacterized protein KUCA_T00004939001 [Kuraishia capsulata CBS 1993]CDK28953.1 unnamed protein product [Kuraishia capsulata CBS 1993]